MKYLSLIAGVRILKWKQGMRLGIRNPNAVHFATNPTRIGRPRIEFGRTVFMNENELDIKESNKACKNARSLCTRKPLDGARIDRWLINYWVASLRLTSF
jgi:hypothetical protein